MPAREGGSIPASGGFSPASREPARIGLPRIYRPFVDALEGTGDWVLIEPYGWVFRPDVNTVAWRPYRDGWWEPSDVYGWIWNSNDEFGWITDHYGAWFHDRFQGWVWQPGPVWGPAWVAWVAAGDRIGWAPLAPEGYRDWDSVPGGAFLFVRAPQFDMEGVPLQAQYARELAADTAELVPVGGEVVIEGQRLVLGPSLERVRSLGGMARSRGEREPRRLPIESAAQAPALESRVRAALQAARREWSARGTGGAPAPAPPAAPRAKSRVAPLRAPVRPATEAADSASARRPEPGRPAADSTRHR